MTFYVFDVKNFFVPRQYLRPALSRTRPRFFRLIHTGCLHIVTEHFTLHQFKPKQKSRSWGNLFVRRKASKNLFDYLLLFMFYELSIIQCNEFIKNRHSLLKIQNANNSVSHQHAESQVFAWSPILDSYARLLILSELRIRLLDPYWNPFLTAKSR